MNFKVIKNNMNNLDKQYQSLLKDILEEGTLKTTRNGKTLSVFGRQIRHNMSDGFPLLTTKKMAFKTMVKELLWFLRGSTRGDELTRQGCHIWDGDMFANYMEDLHLDGRPYTQEEFINKIKTDDEFAAKWGELGPIYGKQWRNWGGIDQIQNAINTLKNNPDSRRLMVNAWNVGELDQMVLPPCHNLWQMYSVEKEGKRYLSIMVNIRSNDIPLGLPFNIASYALLLEIIARIVDMIPDELIINIGDAHIYLNQIEGVKEQLQRKPFELPKIAISNNLDFNDNIDAFLNSCSIIDFGVENYISHPSIKFPLSN
jgi:thymidylate synthase